MSQSLPSYQDPKSQEDSSGTGQGSTDRQAGRGGGIGHRTQDTGHNEGATVPYKPRVFPLPKKKGKI